MSAMMLVRWTGKIYVEKLYLSCNLDDEEVESCKYFAEAFYASGATSMKPLMPDLLCESGAVGPPAVPPPLMLLGAAASTQSVRTRSRDPKLPTGVPRLKKKGRAATTESATARSRGDTAPAARPPAPLSSRRSPLPPRGGRASRDPTGSHEFPRDPARLRFLPEEGLLPPFRPLAAPPLPATPRPPALPSHVPQPSRRCSPDRCPARRRATHDPGPMRSSGAHSDQHKAVRRGPQPAAMPQRDQDFFKDRLEARP
ncbi:uncharacterized protein [Canis lupus baileyi]|uniref:uncharacterized protein n=1 Tax=Canis lupus baileyi TaxID=143281 RepID=UPI003B970107